MRIYFVIVCFVFAVIGVVWGQPILIYNTGGAGGKYVLSRNYGDDKVSVSETIIADSFAVRRDASFYQVILTNALVLRAKSIVVSSPSVTTNFEQVKFSTDVWTASFPTNTKVLFNNSITDLGLIQFSEVSSTNMIEYEGVGAIKKLKEMGLEPPEDMDWKKAANK